MQPISKSLLDAIEQLRPKLPILLGQDYESFAAQLEAVLREGDEDEVDKLFMRHHKIYIKLQGLLVQQKDERKETKASPLLGGDSKGSRPKNVILENGERQEVIKISASVKHGTLFYCPESKQLIELPQEALNNSGENYSCPTHHQSLSKIESDNIEGQVKEGVGTKKLFYCATGKHLLLISLRDYIHTPGGDLLCPDHNKPANSIGME
jgi:hypothetical protein